MKLLLFGGTFDPPHRGHMSILRGAIAAIQPDEVWVMPAGIPPHKQASSTPSALRLEMCSCFRPLFKHMVVSDWEIHQQGKSFTLNTVEWLQGQHPPAQIYLCMGSDMLLSFTYWHRWQQLLRQVVLVVQSRRGEDMQKVEVAAMALEKQGGRVLFTEGKVEEVSSTWLRQQLAKGRDVWREIPPEAAKVICDNNLYQEP